MTLHEAIALYLGISIPSDRVPSLDEIAIAGRAAANWRVRGPLATAQIIHALHVDYNMSYRGIEELIGIDHVTAGNIERRHFGQEG